MLLMATRHCAHSGSLMHLSTPPQPTAIVVVVVVVVLREGAATVVGVEPVDNATVAFLKCSSPTLAQLNAHKITTHNIALVDRADVLT